MSEFGMFPYKAAEVQRWTEAVEAATARREIALAKEACRLLISQYDPVQRLGVNRAALKVLLDFVWHQDTGRLRREVDALIAQRGFGEPVDEQAES